MLAAWVQRWLPVAGLALTLLAVTDPLEGFPLVLIGGVLTVMAAIQDRSPRLALALTGIGLAALGCLAMVVLSAAGGVGPATGRSRWWLAAIAPYPVGVLAFTTAAILLLRDRAAAKVR